MARPKRIIEETKIDSSDEQTKFKLVNKRQIDIHRDEYGNLDNIEIDFDIDVYTFRGLSLNGAVFRNVTFKNANFNGVDFSKITLINCKFINCDMKWSIITETQLDSNVIENCNIRERNVIS